MIVCDADNLTDDRARPSPEVIREQHRLQTEALQDIRRRLREAVLPPAMTIIPAGNSL